MTETTVTLTHRRAGQLLALSASIGAALGGIGIGSLFLWWAS